MISIAAIAQLHDRVHRDAVVVAVVVNLAIERLGQHPQVADQQRLEQQPQPLQILQEPIGAAAEGRHRQGGIAEVAPGRLAQGCLRAQMGPPGGLVFQHHQPFQGLQMVGHGARVERPIGAAGIGRQGGQVYLGGYVAAEGAQQRPQALAIPPPPIPPLHVHLAHLLEVVTGGAAGGAHGPLQLGRPAAAAAELGKIRHRQPWIGAARWLPRQQCRQRHAALAGS